MEWVALDIGGANLKSADGRGFAVCRPFPLWRRPRELARAVRELLLAGPRAEAIAVTMTGELADCFRTKREGVGAILTAVAEAAAGRRVEVYLVDGRWASPADAAGEPELAAASNWHALAQFTARYLAGASGLAIDIGSTTSDIIPLVAGQPAARGRTDTERLVEGELVYTGVKRSPVCALVKRVPWKGADCPVAQELFATAWDAYLLLRELPESAEACHTADGRPATREAAHDRLARMVCADRDLVSRADSLRIAEAVAIAQEGLIAEAVRRVLVRLPEARSVILCGEGEFLARRVLEACGLEMQVVSLEEKLGASVSAAATAHALAVLARERAPR